MTGDNRGQFTGPPVWLIVILVTAMFVALILFHYFGQPGIEEFSQWCHAHNGTLKGQSAIYCELPSGAKVKSHQVMYE